MTLKQLNLIATVVENDLNLSKAAEQLHFVQSAASHQLALIERELGMPLFKRNGRRLVATTPLCDKIVPHIRHLHQSHENILKIAEEDRLGDKGTLRIATTHAQAKYFLPAVVKRFRKTYPRVTIHFHQGNPLQLVDMLLKGKADIAICTEELEEAEALVAVNCYDWNHVLITLSGHPLATGPLSLKRIAEYPMLTYVRGFTGRLKVQRIFEQAGFDLDIAFEAADTDVIKTYVKLGFGAGIIAGMCYEPAADQDLVKRDLSKLLPKSATKIAYLPTRYLNRFTTDFIDLVKKNRPRLQN